MTPYSTPSDMPRPAHSSPMRKALLVLIRGYQLLLSPLFGNRCRFYPSCSHYAMEAISRHGCLKGSLLTAHRVLRCNPLASGGLDPVPEASPKTETKKP